MDSFDLKPERKVRINKRSLIWDILTVLILIGTACQAYVFLTIFLNPKMVPAFLRPLPVPTLFSTSTPTITPIQLQPTWTYTSTLVPSPSRTRAPTWTPLPGMEIATDTPVSSDTPASTETGEPSITPAAALASANITFRPSTDFYSDKGCNWFGIAGQVLDAAGNPLPDQTIQMGGTLDGKSTPGLYISGMTASLKPIYGDAAFEFVLGDKPVASTQSLWVQLFDNTSQPLTDKIYFDTFTDCAKNMVYIVFKKAH